MLHFSEKNATVKDWSTGVVSPRPTFEGATLGSFTRTERVMSDVWDDVAHAVVWDGEKVVHTWPGDGPVTVDATPEVFAAARAFMEARAGAEWLAARHRIWDGMVNEAKRVAVGRTVEVVKGRKVPKGTVGDVFWMGEGKFGVRVGLKDAAGTVHWTAVTNVEVVNPEDFIEVPADFPPSAALVAARGRDAVKVRMSDLRNGNGWASVAPDAWLLSTEPATMKEAA